jgi:hypothetical protein
VVWAEDATISGATVTSLQELDDQLVILPKLFRRLIDYLALGAGDISLAGFVAFLSDSGHGPPAWEADASDRTKRPPASRWGKRPFPGRPDRRRPRP